MEEGTKGRKYEGGIRGPFLALLLPIFSSTDFSSHPPVVPTVLSSVLRLVYFNASPAECSQNCYYSFN